MAGINSIKGMSNEIHKDCNNCVQGSKSIFCALKTEELELINQSKRCQIFEKGETIFQEAAAPKGIFCIEKGKVKVSQLGLDGKDQILHLAKDGDVMGYRATLSGDIYSCSATAIEQSHICFIPKDVFISLVEKNSKLALQIIHLFSKELKKIETNLTKITQRPVKERIAQSLLLLKNKYGVEADEATINITIKREEIANMAGTTRETATRVLYHLQENNVIELLGKKIKIINFKILINEANILD
jgi:CRP/FNR family transcriptional regulator